MSYEEYQRRREAGAAPRGGSSAEERSGPPREGSRGSFRLVGDYLDARSREQPLEEVRV